jgi:hypothetical protein
MATQDVLIVETLNGGDLNKINNDVVIAYGWENMPYIALFGGNPQQSTPTERIDGEQNFDWWGNGYEANPIVQINSETERTLSQVNLNSSGRILIEQAVLRDLNFMTNFANVSVDVSIISDDRVQIDIAIIEPTNLQNKQYRYIWDSTRGAIEIISNYNPPIPDIEGTFDDTFDNTFN